MSVQFYRNTFQVVLADTDAMRGQEILNSLADAGYKCEQRFNKSSLLEMLLKNPPHILIFNYDDQGFFKTTRDYQDFIEQVKSIVNSVHIVCLCTNKNIHRAHDLYEYDIYDCVLWPLIHPRDLLHTIDRAAENEFHIQFNHDPAILVAQDGGNSSQDFAYFDVWLKSLDKCENKDQAIHLWMKEISRRLGTHEALYLKYIESQNSLALISSIGFKSIDLQNIGIDLESDEPGFEPSMLMRPERMYCLSEFVKVGLLRQHAIFLPLVYSGRVQGVFILPAATGKYFSQKQREDGYIGATLTMLTRYFELSELRAKFLKSSVYEMETEALRDVYFLKRVKEEISRSRRLYKPVSMLYIAIDRFAEIELSHSKDSVRDLLRSFSELLIRNSRLNDFVGSVKRGQFCLCLPHTELRGAAIKAERLRRMIETADVGEILGAGRSITVSIGISEYPRLCHDTDTLIQSAEMAYYDIRKSSLNEIRISIVPPHFEPDFIVKENNSVTGPSS